MRILSNMTCSVQLSHFIRCLCLLCCYLDWIWWRRASTSDECEAFIVFYDNSVDVNITNRQYPLYLILGKRAFKEYKFVFSRAIWYLCKLKNVVDIECWMEIITVVCEDYSNNKYNTCYNYEESDDIYMG